MLASPNFWRSRILVFDVNETLLDMNALVPHFERVFGSGEALRQWFSQTLLYSQTLTLIGKYIDFTDIALRSLEMTAMMRSAQLSQDDVVSIRSAMKTLPPHREVPGALRQLGQAGFRLIALTNSAHSIVESQMRSAELTSLFERIVSVDSIRKYKPHPDVYGYVAAELKVETGDLLMIAAHPWDLMGAAAAGCNVAYLERAGTSWNYLAPKPQIFGRDMEELATRLISLAADSR